MENILEGGSTNELLGPRDRLCQNNMELTWYVQIFHCLGSLLQTLPKKDDHSHRPTNYFQANHIGKASQTASQAVFQDNTAVSAVAEKLQLTNNQGEKL